MSQETLLATGEPYDPKRGLFRRQRPILLSGKQRTRHLFCLGPPGSGKTRLLEHLATEDIEAGHGLCVIEPEGGLTRRLLARLMARYPTLEQLAERVVIVEPARGDQALPLNVLAVSEGENRYLPIEHTVSCLKRCWATSWGPRLEDLLRNTFLVLQAFGLTLNEAILFLSHREFRQKLCQKIDDPALRYFWVNHLEAIRQHEYRVWIESSRNKLDQLVNPFLKPFFAQNGCFDFRTAMDEGKLIFVNIDQGRLQESGALLASLLMTRLYLSSLRRDELGDPKFFSVFCDEFASYHNRSIDETVNRSRKRGLGLHLFVQNLEQPPFGEDPWLAGNLIASCQTLVSFGASRKDAERLVGEFFTLKGDRVKDTKRHIIWGSFGEPRYWSVAEEREHFIAQLQNQQDRECVISIRGEGERRTYFAETCEVSDDLPVPLDEVERFKALCHKAHSTSLAEVERQVNERRERIQALFKESECLDRSRMGPKPKAKR